MLPVLSVLLDQIAAGAEAQVVLGNALHLAIDRHQLAGFTELLREIPPDTDFGLRRRSRALPKFITQYEKALEGGLNDPERSDCDRTESLGPARIRPGGA
jgi:hypothetical protein